MKTDYCIKPNICLTKNRSDAKRLRHRKRTINLGTINRQGWGGKLKEIIRDLKEHQFEILALMEKKKTVAYQKKNMRKEGYSSWYTKKLKNKITDWETITEKQTFRKGHHKRKWRTTRWKISEFSILDVKLRIGRFELIRKQSEHFFKCLKN